MASPSTNSSLKPGVILMIVGVVIIFSPLAIAFLATAPGANMWSEGDSSSGGAAIWLMFITIPLGGIIGIIGFIMMIVGAAKGAKSATSAGEEKQV